MEGVGELDRRNNFEAGADGRSPDRGDGSPSESGALA